MCGQRGVLATVSWQKVLRFCCCSEARPHAPCPCAGGGPGKLAEVTYANATAKWEVTAEFEGGVGGATDDTFTPHGFVRSRVLGGRPGMRGACVLLRVRARPHSNPHASPPLRARTTHTHRTATAPTAAPS